MKYGTGCPSCGAGVDKLTSVTDANQNTTIFEYDQAGNLIKETSPLGFTTTYQYDPAGNLLFRVDANGKRTDYAFDELNRLREIKYPDQTTAAFGYDYRGNPKTAANLHIAYSFEYDLNNRLTRVSDSEGKAIRYGYNTLGNRIKMIRPDQRILEYQYDPRNYLSQILLDSVPSFFFAHDAYGRRLSLKHLNIAMTHYSYDPSGYLKSLLAQDSGGSLLNSFAYTYDGVGNRKTLTDLSGLHQYEYDKVYQLVRATHPDMAEEKFSYDPVGNRLNTGVDEDNRLREDKRFSYEHDNNGNLIKKIHRKSGEVTTYAYDFENRLIEIRTPKKMISYKYDPYGRRIGEEINGKISRYAYDGWDLILEYGEKGNLKSGYIHSLGIDEPLALERGKKTYYYHADGLGSITDLTDGKGNIVKSYVYKSFGQLHHQSGSLAQPFRFTGREFDPESGLYYYRARYYNPRTGRFLTKDPIGFGGGDRNLYRYVANNPINLVDPLGLYGWEVHYYKTYIWAREVGIDHATAQAIAEANQSVDEMLFQHPHYPTSWLVGGLWMHFPYRGSTELELMKCSKLRQVNSFGRQLHMLQDSFSHQGIGPVTHAYRGHAPDKYSENNPRDQEMGRATKWWLMEFKKSLDRRPFK